MIVCAVEVTETRPQLIVTQVNVPVDVFADGSHEHGKDEGMASDALFQIMFPVTLVACSDGFNVPRESFTSIYVEDKPFATRTHIEVEGRRFTLEACRHERTKEELVSLQGMPTEYDLCMKEWGELNPLEYVLYRCVLIEFRVLHELQARGYEERWVKV